jgi:hypothetical protein
VVQRHAHEGLRDPPVTEERRELLLVAFQELAVADVAPGELDQHGRRRPIHDVLQVALLLLAQSLARDAAGAGHEQR